MGFNFKIETLMELTLQLKVLYVEDNKEARESTTGLLENIFKDITVAIDGKDGLEKFSQNPQAYDLVISDINMPNMNGIQMVQKIKEKSDTIKVCLLSAYNDEEYPIDTNIKIDARFSKPIDLNNFFTALNKMYAIKE